MKKNLKIFLILILAVIGVIVLNPSAKHNVVRYVKNNNVELTATAENIIEENITVNAEYNSWRVDYYIQSDTPVVEFTVSRFGIVPSNHYKGFYYSPDDIPIGYQGAETEFLQNGSRWEYSCGGDNTGFTEKICDNWYWFEMKF